MTVPNPYSAGAAYVDGRITPLAEAAISLTDYGYRRSDVTYDVVSVWDGAFFRLDDHIARFRASMKALRLDPGLSNDDIRSILMQLVRLSGLRDAYVAMDCLRGAPKPGLPPHPLNCRNYLAAFARPYVWVMAPEVQARGIHLITADVPRIAEASIDPTVKNFHWGDLTQALFQAHDQGADTAILLDEAGMVTEGPGFNLFSIREGVIATPERGALEGITRKSVIELCAELGLPCEVRPVPIAELRAADEIFICTTAGGVMPVSRIDDHIMGNDRPGPISASLRERYWTRRTEGWHATPVDYRQ